MIKQKWYLAGIVSSLLLLSVALDASSKKTKQEILPIPFSYFKNLYFEASSQTFYALGDDVDVDNALANIKERGVSLQAVKKLPKVDGKKKVLDGTTLLIFEFPGTPYFCNHFFHLLEHVVGLWSFGFAHQVKDVKRIILPTDDVSWKGTNEINAHLLKALYPNAAIMGWQTFLKEQEGIVKLERTLISDRSMVSKSIECQRINKHLGAALPNLSVDALNELALRVNEYAETVYAPRNQIAITFVKRPMPRTLDANLEKALLDAIEEIPGVSLRVVDFAAISFKKQINIVGNTDILIGVHGNGLSHILFLPSTAAAIEIAPPNSLALDYMLYANARKINFLEVSASSGVISAEEAYQFGPYGNMNSTIYYLDFEPILAFIRSYVK